MGILLHYFIQNKSAAEAEATVETYGDNALTDTTCRHRFRRFKNNDFKLEDRERPGAPKNLKTKNWREYSMKTDLRC